MSHSFVLAALKDPELALKINAVGIENAEKIARLDNSLLYIPSSTDTFGDSVQRLTTIYGVYRDTICTA